VPSVCILTQWLLDDAEREAPRSQRPRRRARRLTLVCGIVLLCLVVGFVVQRAVSGGDDSEPGSQPPSSQPTHDTTRPAPTAADGSPYRAFDASSWWNSPVPDDAPHNAHESAILDYLRTGPDNAGGCLRLAGSGQNPWGQPVYWARPGDPTYDVGGMGGRRPPELSALRIPRGAEAADNSDGSISIFDLAAGYVTLMTDAHYHAATDTWSASGGTVTYLDSNGLDHRTGLSDDPRNKGTHRGNNGATSVVRWDEVQAGAVDHVLKVSSGPELSSRWGFPMTGSDGHGPAGDPAVPPEGLRLRIKPSVDLGALGLDPQALVIARALQSYGMYLGDSGGTTALKLEDTTAEGRGSVWDVTNRDLCGLPFSPAYWDVLPEGYNPSSGP
jgi:hypothetical protein